MENEIIRTSRELLLLLIGAVFGAAWALVWQSQKNVKFSGRHVILIRALQLFAGLMFVYTVILGCVLTFQNGKIPLGAASYLIIWAAFALWAENKLRRIEKKLRKEKSN
jgi:hypothetical protein